MVRIPSDHAVVLTVAPPGLAACCSGQAVHQGGPQGAPAHPAVPTPVSESLVSRSRADAELMWRESQATRDVRMRGEYGASGTSFYTTTEKEDYYDTLEAVLEKKCAGTPLHTGPLRTQCTARPFACPIVSCSPHPTPTVTTQQYHHRSSQP
jgi:hypothetical protein